MSATTDWISAVGQAVGAVGTSGALWYLARQHQREASAAAWETVSKVTFHVSGPIGIDPEIQHFGAVTVTNDSHESVQCRFAFRTVGSVTVEEVWEVGRVAAHSSVAILVPGLYRRPTRDGTDELLVDRAGASAAGVYQTVLEIQDRRGKTWALTDGVLSPMNAFHKNLLKKWTQRSALE